jgi:FMN reductase
MTERSLVVVTAGLSQPSSSRLLADRLAAATETALAESGIEVRTEVVELRPVARPLVDHLVTGFPGPELEATIERVLRADGLIVVTPVFNASYSGLFKLFFDVLELESLDGVPVLLAATGGTPRHSLVIDHALRPLFSYLGASAVPTGVFAASEDWGQAEEVHIALAERIDRAGAELARAMAGGARTPIADPFAEPPEFGDLLRDVASGDPAPKG